MPVLAVVNGVTITMYYDDHVPPHFHVSRVDKGHAMDTRVDEDVETAGTWTLQTVVGVKVTEEQPFTVLLTIKDKYRASVCLAERGTGPLAVVLRDPEKFREIFVDDELGTIAWPNGYDIDPDRLRMLAMEQHPEDPAAIPPSPPWCRT